MLQCTNEQVKVSCADDLKCFSVRLWSSIAGSVFAAEEPLAVLSSQPQCCIQSLSVLAAALSTHSHSFCLAWVGRACSVVFFGD